MKIGAGDELVIYGKLSILRTLDSRRAGVQGDHDRELAVEKKQGAESRTFVGSSFCGTLLHIHNFYKNVICLVCNLH